jgi:hypothetical protein
VCDAELVALAVCQAAMGISCDRQFLGLVGRVLPGWFPHLPDQSQYNRRLRMLVELISLVQQRLARWLLTVSDRAETDTIPLTHEFAAILVGGDRPRVSLALRSLRDRHLVEQRRGQLRILDRAGLTKAACACYLRVATPIQN